MTWTSLTQGLDGNKAYYSIRGDGNTLYTAWTLNFGAPPGPIWKISPESDGTTWTAHNGGTEHFSDGPLMLRFDPFQRIMYSTQWKAGIWALKVVDP